MIEKVPQNKPSRTVILLLGISLISWGVTSLTTMNDPLGVAGIVLGLLTVYSYEIMYEDLLDKIDRW